ncbi:TIGR01212 family radical SAM protein [Anaerotignum sp. MB30-C6]|uniref:TIGR01212 family radical SAM protein n=1 Tax=Anaerotignum sp. MB30-C6 TaxID=3070814 RepID=UPI0027DC4275|nr:TIGR01212 family radical SAM protein [Anaerotignum sp. MB30-C6]WMI81558.1 TIGR01212 family radical SAM protein [Anaerotignum sp. MB30-C6]
MAQYPYLSLNEYYRSLFGKKTAKISLDGGFTCPNRDGTLSTGGCIFCSVGGSGDFAEDFRLSIREQVEKGRAQTQKKWPDACYIAYFQAFTNTYAPVNVLRAKYEEALAQPQIAGLSIATRADCLGDDVLELLQELSHKTKIWVELGLQTSCEDTAKFIRRGYSNEIFTESVYKLHAIQIPVVAHVILGLPNETPQDMLKTIDFINQLPIQGVKLQLMHVLTHTDLESLYRSGTYIPLEKDEYLEILCQCISRLRPDIVIHRLTGDGDKNTLLAPLWSLHKRDVLNRLHELLRKKNIHQGDSYYP